MDTFELRTGNDNELNTQADSAVAMLEEMSSIERILTEFESHAAQELDEFVRINQLVDLNRWYANKFGVPFEMRHFYRKELLGVINKETRSSSEAIKSAKEKYERVNGIGLPCMIRLIVGSTRHNLTIGIRQ